MANYYFIATLLPPLKIGSAPEIGSRELDFFLRHNLSKADFAKVTALRSFIDLENIQSIWRKEPIRDEGNLNELELEECLLFKEGLPPYVIEYMQTYKDTKQRLQYFPQLLHLFFETETNEQTGYLADYFRFEWQWRLVFVALRAKELGRDLPTEMQYENPENPFIAELLAQNESHSLKIPEPYLELQRLFETKKQAPLDLYESLLEWRFNQIDERMEWESFSITRILGYVTQSYLVEEWLKQDKRKGIEVVDQIYEKSQIKNPGVGNL